MRQQYTVPTKNTFALLADDSDNEDAILSKPDETLAVAEPPRQAAAKPTANQDATQSQRARDNNGQPQSRVRRPEGVPPRKPRGPDGNSPIAGTNEIPEGEARRAPASNRGRGGVSTGAARFNAPRGGGAPRPVREGQREFDRRSGTGRGTEMKKEGAGAHNWGRSTDFEEGNQNEWAAANGEQDAPVVSGGETHPVTTGEEAGPKEETQPLAAAAPTLQSYAQYKAARAEKQSALPTHKLETGASGEAKQQKLIQDGYQIYTKETTVAANPEEKEDPETEDEKTRPRTMHLAEVAEQSGVFLNYGGRGQRGGRGGRGGVATTTTERRGNGKPPGATQGSQPTAPKEINLSDKQAFPTLQAH